VGTSYELRPRDHGDGYFAVLVVKVDGEELHQHPLTFGDVVALLGDIQAIKLSPAETRAAFAMLRAAPQPESR
jgi:hypothetical protein